MSDDWRHGGFGVYVHWPYCLAKCPYCDFNSHVGRTVDPERWRRALVGEVDSAASEVPGRRVDSIFFGGGTPSLMAPDLVAAVIEAVAARWSLADKVEITLEANPTSVEAGRFQGFRDAGVNRISMGLQALDDGPDPHGNRSRRGVRDRAGDLSAGQLRSDLCAAAPDPRGLEERAAQGARPRRRSSVALPIDDRGRHAVRRSRKAWSAEGPSGL